MVSTVNTDLMTGLMIMMMMIDDDDVDDDDDATCKQKKCALIIWPVFFSMPL